MAKCIKCGKELDNTYAKTWAICESCRDNIVPPDFSDDDYDEKNKNPQRRALGRASIAVLVICLVIGVIVVGVIIASSHPTPTTNNPNDYIDNYIQTQERLNNIAKNVKTFIEFALPALGLILVIVVVYINNKNKQLDQKITATQKGLILFLVIIGAIMGMIFAIMSSDNISSDDVKTIAIVSIPIVIIMVGADIVWAINKNSKK